MVAATVTSKGQVTIPAEVRKALGLRSGSRVAFVETGAGSYELVAETRTIKALKGVVARSAEIISIDEMDVAISAAAAESMAR